MLKKLTTARSVLIPFVLLEANMAWARGLNDGSNRQNSFTTEVVGDDNDQLYLHVWNVYNESWGWQLHGDIEIKTTNGLDGYGGAICIGQPDDNMRFDCISFGVFV